MNNKGFAITGIIYTLFVLFLTILLTILSGISVYQRLLFNSLTSFEEDLSANKTIDDSTTLNSYIATGTSPYYGKYIFTLKIPNRSDLECASYISSLSNFKNNSNLIFTTKDCNDYKENYELEWINSDITTCTNNNGCITLTKIYKFKEGE